MTITAGADVWYISYGSNMNEDRLRYYIEGGTPPGSRKLHQGSADQTPIRGTRPVAMPGGIFFGDHKSLNWNAAVAFYDPELPGAMPAVAHRITQRQFNDLTWQEMDLDPTREPDIDMPKLLAEGRLQVGPGWYGELRVVGEIEGVPAVTFTGPSDATSVRGRAPSLGYLKMLATGLEKNFRWSPERAARYLANRPGAKGAWHARPLAALLRENPLRDPALTARHESQLDHGPLARRARVTARGTESEAAAGTRASGRGLSAVARRTVRRVVPSAGKARVIRGAGPRVRMATPTPRPTRGTGHERGKGA